MSPMENLNQESSKGAGKMRKENINSVQDIGISPFYKKLKRGILGCGGIMVIGKKMALAASNGKRIRRQ